MADSTNRYRAFAQDAYGMFSALIDEGFTPDQATAVLCQIVAQPNPQQGRRPTASMVEQLLAGAVAKGPTRSPVDDRTAHIWQKPPTTPPTAADTPEPQPAPEGAAPAHD